MSNARAKILCIEDEPELLEDLACELRDAGYEVMTASSGERGLALLLNECPQVVLCDIQLPGLGGFSILEGCLAARETRSLPFFMMTAYGDNQTRQRSISAGATGVIIKPLDYNKLLKMLEGLLQK